ncbi:MAG: hypothetical protein PHE50_01905 [Dehalococcoidales bacterium]|nr:hypothetical protein [Dehalococcoidales bacterium]
MAINGTYNVTIDTPMGAQTGNVSFKCDGSTLSGSYQTSRGSQNFTGIAEGDKAKWSISVPSPMGGQINLSFDCKVTDSDLTGSVQLGQFGTAPIKGKKA